VPSELAQRLYYDFVEYGYTWKIDGVLRTPSAEDLDIAIDSAKKALYDEPVPSQVMWGRLIIRQHESNQFDIYLLIGEIND